MASRITRNVPKTHGYLENLDRKEEDKLEINEGFREELEKTSEDEVEEETAYPEGIVDDVYAKCQDWDSVLEDMEINGDQGHLPEDNFTSETIESPDDVISVKGIEDHPQRRVYVKDVHANLNLDTDKPEGKPESSGSSFVVDVFVTIILCDDISLKLPSSLAAKLQPFQAIPWTTARRSSLDKIGLDFADRFESDIYSFVPTDVLLKLQDVGMEDDETSNFKDYDVFNVYDSYASDITFKFTLKHYMKESLYNLCAKIKTTEKSWISIDVQYNEAGYVTFSCCNICSLCIVASPRIERCTLTPEGYRFVPEDDTSLYIDFPAGTVDKNEEIKVQLVPVAKEDMRTRLEKYPDIYDILAMSKCIFVDHTVNKFKKTMEVQFTMDNVLLVDPEDPRYELAFFYWENGIAKRASGKSITRQNENYIVEVDHFSGVSCAIVRRNARLSPLEPYLVYGMLHTCTILIFIKRRKEDMVSLWCECTKREMARAVAKKRIEDHELEEIDCSHSKDIFVREGQRIRIDVSGSIQFVREIPKSFYLLTFIPVAEDNHIYFPLQKNVRMGSVPYGVINFSADNQRKQLLHSVHFDPWVRSATALKKYHTDIAIYKRPYTSKTDPGTNKTPRSPRKGCVQFDNVVNTAAQCVRDWFDNEKNLLAIANQIPVKKLLQFGIHLCIRSEDIHRLKKDYNENDEELQFFFMKFWARRVKSYLKPDARLEQLTKAMGNIGLQREAEVVKKIFKSKEDLTDDHFIIST